MKRILLILSATLIALGAGTAYSQNPEIPTWIKGVVGLWADGEVSDVEFVNALEFLINAGVIKVDNQVSVDDYNTLADDYDLLYDEYDEVYDEYDALIDDYNTLADDYDLLYDEYDEVYDEYDALIDDYSTLADDYDLLYGECDYPLVEIYQTEVWWYFCDSKGNSYEWSMPITTYEDLIEDSRELSYYNLYEDPYRLDLNGRTIKMTSLEGFVQNSFADVIDDIYANSDNDSDFIWEVWYIVSQLTVWDEDLTQASEGRFALETFTRTGGDCEDLTILVADMLMSSSRTSDWSFEYVLFDADNPTNPQEVNHVILVVHDEQYGYFIEATAPPSWDHYPNGWWGGGMTSYRNCKRRHCSVELCLQGRGAPASGNWSP